MRKLKIIIYLSIISLQLIVLSGCWNYREVTDLAIISGFAVDYDKEKKEFIITVEEVSIQQEKNELIAKVYEGKGDTIFDAVRNLIYKAGKKLFWSHNKIVVLSKSLIEDKKAFISCLDWMYRNEELEVDMYLVFSGEDKAGDILNQKIGEDPKSKEGGQGSEGGGKQEEKSEDKPSVVYHMIYILANSEQISKFYPIEVMDFIENLATNETNSVMPIVKKIGMKKENENMIPGLIVFKKLDIVGELNEYDSRNYLILTNRLKGGVIPVDVKSGNDKIRLSLEVSSNTTDIKVNLKNKKIKFNIDAKMECSITEVGETKGIFNRNLKDEIEKQIATAIKKDIQKTINKIQKKLKSDILGFGRIVNIKDKNLWKTIKSNWNETFSNSDISLNVNVRIVGSAAKDATIKIGE